VPRDVAVAILDDLPVSRLVCSVPNEEFLPFDKATAPYHERHYTEAEFVSLLADGGWGVQSMHHQEGPYSDVGDVPGRTLVAYCERM